MLLLTIFFLISCLIPIALTRCTNETAVVRKEWLELTPAERESYITAIKCLQNLPSQLADIIPASRSAYDDFAAVHANVTRSVHFSGIFYSWHRHYLQLLETALHTRCSYPPTLGVPYWNWALPAYQRGLATSPLFDGGPLSLGGDGADVGKADQPVRTAGGTLPHGRGGGCVTTGPFANTTVPFGPFTIAHLFTGLPATWALGNPHCLSRDLNDAALRLYNNAESVSRALGAAGIGEFQSVTSGWADPGVHGGGHLAVGETMNDPYGSPQDCVFWLHHGMLDRVWGMWQAADSTEARRYEYDGTSTVFNAADTDRVGNETVLRFGVLGEDIRVMETADHMSGRYCYRYT